MTAVQYWTAQARLAHQLAGLYELKALIAQLDGR